MILTTSCNINIINKWRFGQIFKNMFKWILHVIEQNYTWYDVKTLIKGTRQLSLTPSQVYGLLADLFILTAKIQTKKKFGSFVNFTNLSHNLTKLIGYSGHHAFLKKNRNVFVKHGCPGGNKVKIWHNLLSPTFWPPPHAPQGHVMSVKCEQSLDELTVWVWLLYDHPNFKYCT